MSACQGPEGSGHCVLRVGFLPLPSVKVEVRGQWGERVCTCDAHRGGNGVQAWRRAGVPASRKRLALAEEALGPRVEAGQRVLDGGRGPLAPPRLKLEASSLDTPAGGFSACL